MYSWGLDPAGESEEVRILSPLGCSFCLSSFHCVVWWERLCWIFYLVRSVKKHPEYQNLRRRHSKTIQKHLPKRRLRRRCHMKPAAPPREAKLPGGLRGPANTWLLLQNRMISYETLWNFWPYLRLFVFGWFCWLIFSLMYLSKAFRWEYIFF